MIIVMTMVTVSKSALKARMLEFFRDVERTGEELVVTSDGVPVLKVVPFTEARSVDDAFADVRGALTWTGDIDAPTNAEWPAP
jgi:antitoxin (DNA-binding transcriptional repressor) of toxin-antitoxin stability system